MGGDWRRGFEYAWQAPDPEPDGGPGLTWRELTPRHWSGSWNAKLHGTVTLDGDGWLAYVRLEDPPGLSPITTVGRYSTVEEAQVATERGVGVPLSEPVIADRARHIRSPRPMRRWASRARCAAALAP
jgi:hypothetical protein